MMTQQSGKEVVVIYGEYYDGYYWARRKKDGMYLSHFKALEEGENSPQVWNEKADYNRTLKAKHQNILEDLAKWVLPNFALVFEYDEPEAQKERA